MDIIRKTREDYNKIAYLFAKTRENPGELIKFKPFITNGQHILDWGCGNGRLVFILDGLSVDYYGTDQSEGMIKQAKKMFKAQVAKGHTHFLCTARTEKKFPDNYFDIVFLIASFHHLPDEQSRLKVLRTIGVQMKPGARLIMTNWNLHSAWAKEKFKGGWKNKGNDYFVPWKLPDSTIVAERYYHHFTVTEMKTLLKKAGLQVEKMYYATRDGEVDKKTGKNLVVYARKSV